MFPQTKCLKAELKKIVNGYGIVRCEEKKSKDFFGDKLYGQTLVFYDVCLEEGKGDCIETFKTMKAAEKFCRDN